MTEMDTLTIVRRRLADGRTIADSDVHKLVAQIDQLKAELSEAIERGNDWCDQAKKARAERDRAREALSRLIGAVDLANASLARGEGEQWIHSQLAPAAGAARASLDPAPLFGRWPGDESDEEIERLLKDF